MTQLTLQTAIDLAIAEEMRRDPRVIFFGEGVATKRHQLVTEFGGARVRNTPLAENIIAGTAAGAAASGLRPIVDLLFAPFLCFAMDPIVNSAGKLRYLSGGQFSFPMVVLAATGAGWGVGGQHNHNLEAWFAHAPGLKVVMPSNASDAKGLLKAAIRDENPVLFFSDIGLLFAPSEVDDAQELVPIGKASTLRSGTDLTFVSYGKTVGTCLEAAEQLAERGIQAEVLDLRTVKPLDEEAVLASAQKTGRVVVVHEANGVCGIGAEVAAVVADKAFRALKGPVVRVTGPDAPAPAAFHLEQAMVPTVERVVRAAERCLKKEESPLAASGIREAVL